MLEGALDCWVFLSCLEVLHRIEGCCDQAQLEANVSHTVGLWAYATDKVGFHLGSCLLRSFSSVLLPLHCLLFGVLGWVSVNHFVTNADVKRALIG